MSPRTNDRTEPRFLNKIAKTGQSAVELLSTYAWAFIIIAILVATVGIYISLGAGARYLPSQCNIQPLLPCPQSSLSHTTSNQISYKILTINNLAPYMYFTANGFTVSSEGINPSSPQNYTGSCEPAIAAKGDEVICTVNIPSTNAPPIGSSVNLEFSLKYQICLSSAVSSCGLSQYTSTGASFQPLSAYASNLYKLTLLSNPNSTIVINGQRYIATTSGAYIYLPFGSYIIYSIPPQGYSFAGWSASPSPTNITISSQSAQNTTMRLRGNSTLTALINAITLVSTSTTTIIPGLPTSTTTTTSTTTSTSTTVITSTSTTVTTTSTTVTTTGYYTCNSCTRVTTGYSCPSNCSNGVPCSGAGGTDVDCETSTTSTTTSTSTTTTTIAYIYCVGGGGTSTYNATYSAPVSGGTVGSWTAQVNYPIAMEEAGCSIYNGYLYCVGSDTSPYDQVYSAPVSGGTIGTWTAQTSYPISMYNAGCSIYSGYIYCVGTGGTYPYTAVYSAPVSGGTVGSWTAQTSYPISMYNAGCSIYSGYIYCVGTEGTSSENQVYSAPVSGGTVGSWAAQTNSYPIPMYDAYCEIDGSGSGGGFYGGGGPSS